MTKVNLYNDKGTKKDVYVLPKEYSVKLGSGLFSQSLRVFEDGTHLGTSYAKTRAEVNKTGAKVWKQKGTGNARHGSRRAPIFVGGGKAHGPKGIKRNLGLSEKVRKTSLLVSVALKSESNSLVVVDNLKSIKSTKEAATFLNAVIASQGLVKGKKTTVVLSEKNPEVSRCFSNIANTRVCVLGNINAFNIFTGGLIVVEKNFFESKIGSVKPVIKGDPKGKVIKKETKKVVAKSVSKKVTKAKKSTKK